MRLKRIRHTVDETRISEFSRKSASTGAYSSIMSLLIKAGRTGQLCMTPQNYAEDSLNLQSPANMQMHDSEATLKKKPRQIQYTLL